MRSFHIEAHFYGMNGSIALVDAVPSDFPMC